MNHFFLLIGSNFQSESTIPFAISLLNEELNGLFFTSTTLQSEAINKKGQVCSKTPPYSNVVGFGLTSRTKEDMLDLLRSIEMKSGRIRSVNQPKLVHLDLDLVEWNNEMLRTWEMEQHFYKACKKKLLDAFQTIFSNNEFSKETL